MSTERRLQLRRLADVKPRRVRWLLPGLIPYRTLTLVAGVGGLGKSTWLGGIGARVSRGDLDHGQPADVVIVSFEDAAEEVLRPRVEAAQGDLDRVHEIVVHGMEGIDPVRLPRDVSELEGLVHDVQARLVVIDPIVAAIDTALDAHKDQHVRHVLAQLAQLAREADCAIAIVGHLNKTPSQDAYIRVANSVAFWNASRSVVLVTEDPEEPDTQRLVAQRKANYSRLHPVERHRIEEIVLPDTLDAVTGEPIVTSRMSFIEFAEDVERADLLGPRATGESGSKELLAVAYLVGALSDGDWHEGSGVKTIGKAQGLSERTLQRAAQALEVEYEPRGFPATTWWRLPQSRPGFTQSDGVAAAQLEIPHNEAGSEDTREPVTPPTPGGIESGVTGRPILGDEGYLAFIAGVHEDGHITTAEALDLERLHNLIEKARDAAEEAAERRET
jgi:AAA domain